MKRAASSGAAATATADARSLFQCSDLDSWTQASHGYAQCAAALEAAGKRDGFAALDTWVWRDAGKVVRDASLGTDGLGQLMRWKLMRGAFRPSLQKLVESNADATVEACCAKACKGFEGAAGVAASLKTLAELKGVGPATASLLLSASYAAVPFMSDEAYAAATGAKPKSYSMKEYLAFHAAVEAKSKELGSEDWPPRRVEQALWAQHRLHAAAAAGGSSSIAAAPAAKKRRRD